MNVLLSQIKVSSQVAKIMSEGTGKGLPLILLIKGTASLEALSYNKGLNNRYLLFLAAKDFEMFFTRMIPVEQWPAEANSCRYWSETQFPSVFFNEI